MDPVSNPYSPGPGTPPPYLAGRDKELLDMDISIARVNKGLPGQHLIYSGLRGVGKTVLLVAGTKKAKAQHWVVGGVEGDSGVNAIENICLEAESMAKALERRKAGGWLDKVREILQSISLNFGPIGFTLNLQPDEEKSAYLHTYFLTNLFTALGEAAKERGTGVMFVFDEMHEFDKNTLKSILAGLHEVNQQQLPLIIMGAGLPQLTTTLQNSKTYAERLSIKTIGSLNRQAAIETITLPAKKLNVEYTPKAIDIMLEATEGYPYFLQLYSQYVWNYAKKSPITEADAKGVFCDFQNDLDNSLFAGRYQKASSAQRKYIMAMAKIMQEHNNASEVGSKEVAHLLGNKVTTLSQVRDTLIKRGLIFQTAQGSVGFTVPLFNRYLARKMENEVNYGIN